MCGAPATIVFTDIPECLALFRLSAVYIFDVAVYSVNLFFFVMNTCVDQQRTITHTHHFNKSIFFKITGCYHPMIAFSEMNLQIQCFSNLVM